LDAYYASLRVTLSALVWTVEELELSSAEIFGEGVDPFAELPKLKSLDGAHAWFSAVVDRAIASLNARQESFALTKVREALDYIEKRYSDQDLCLPGLCKELYISTSYFSSIFKRYQGRTFVEHLTEFRMRKAMELLRTSALKTYEVAERVGYRDAHYFSLSFRKFAGVTPTEYRGGTEHEHP
jgi:two-component system response regulator YesN